MAGLAGAPDVVGEEPLAGRVVRAVADTALLQLAFVCLLVGGGVTGATEPRDRFPQLEPVVGRVGGVTRQAPAVADRPMPGPRERAWQRNCPVAPQA